MLFGTLQSHVVDRGVKFGVSIISTSSRLHQSNAALSHLHFDHKHSNGAPAPRYTAHGICLRCSRCSISIR